MRTGAWRRRKTQTPYGCAVENGTRIPYDTGKWPKTKNTVEALQNGKNERHRRESEAHLSLRKPGSAL